MRDSSYIARTSGLKTRDYLGYAMVDAAGCLVFSLVTTLLQKFYTDINDPIMGRICDTVKPSRYGRYRPWILYAALPLAVSAVLMFLKLPGLGEEGHSLATCVYATVTYVFFGMAYTVLQIPYGSLASVVTTDVSERSKLSVWRSIGAALGSIPVLLIASFAYAKRVDGSGAVILGENGKAITDLQYAPVIRGVLIMALVSFLMLLVAFRLNRERVKTRPQPVEKGAALRAMKLLFHNRAFVSVSLISMLLLSGQMFTQSFYTYLFDDYFHANWMNLASQACTYSPMLVMMFLLPGMARKIGKKEVCAVGVAAAAIANLVLFFLRGMEPDSLMWIFLALCFVSGCGLTTLVMQLWAMVTDAIDDIEVKTGSRDDGTAYSVFNFFRILGMHYKVEKGAVQTVENLRRMYDLATLIPAVLFGLMALLLLLSYPLSRQKVQELQILKEEKLKESYENKWIDI